MCYLGAYIKFHTPSCLLSVRKGRASENGEKERTKKKYYVHCIVLSHAFFSDQTFFCTQFDEFLPTHARLWSLQDISRGTPVTQVNKLGNSGTAYKLHPLRSLLLKKNICFLLFRIKCSFIQVSITYLCCLFNNAK